jgi:hypothetical protein
MLVTQAELGMQTMRHVEMVTYAAKFIRWFHHLAIR